MRPTAIPRTRYRLCLLSVGSLAFLLSATLQAQEPPLYDGVHAEAGILVFDSQATFDAVMAQLAAADKGDWEFADQAFDEFEASLDFFSLRRHLQAIEEETSVPELRPAVDVLSYFVLDDLLTTVLSPWNEIVIGTTGYRLSAESTLEFTNIDATILALTREGDLFGHEVSVIYHEKTKRTFDPCSGYEGCSNYTKYANGTRRFKSKIWVHNYPFYASVGGRTEHQKLKSGGGWKGEKADRVEVDGGFLATDRHCEETLQLDNTLFESRSQKKSAQDVNSYWGQVVKLHEFLGIHMAREGSQSCERELRLFSCDTETRSCGPETPPPPTGLHIRTKISNGDGTWTQHSANPGDGPGVHTHRALVGDVDMDQKDDLIFVGQDWSGSGLNIRVKRSNGNGTWTSWSQVLGDGAGVHTYPTRVGDVDGDGRADLIFVGQDWSGSGLNVRVKRSNGDGTWTSWSQVLGDGSGVHAHPVRIGDVNGDTYDDLIFVGQNWGGPGLNIRVKHSLGNGQWSNWTMIAGDGAGAGVHTYPSRVGRVDLDNRDDLIFVGQNWSGAGLNVRVKRSVGGGQGVEWSAVLGDGPGVHTHPTLIGDFDGDTLDDLVFVGQNWSGNGLNVRTKFSDGDGTWTEKSQVLGDGNGVHSHRTLVGDFDGDDSDDLVFIGQNW